MITNGSCLCGAVTWEVSAEPNTAYHCHCKICRKAHGAAFATYWFMTPENFLWTGSQDTVTTYPTSASLNRTFCGTCGSTLPVVASPWMPEETEDGVYVPAGSHDYGPAPQIHIFIAHKAPWHVVTGELTQHDEYPPPNIFGTVPDPQLSPAQHGGVRGGCLCGAIQFEVVEPFKMVHQCHCGRCRRARAAAHATNGFTSVAGVVFTKGETKIKIYKVPEAKHFSHAFCGTCGSGMPRVDSGRQISVTPLGSLDDDPGFRPVHNIFVASKAAWYNITDGLPEYAEMPPT